MIGINAAIATKTGMFAGYGFAIPVNLAKIVAMDLIKKSARTASARLQFCRIAFGAAGSAGALEG